MIDDGESDAKIIAVPAKDPRFKDMNDIKDINPHTIYEINHFFETYKMLQNKKVEISGTHNREEALDIINESIKLFKDKLEKEEK